MPYIKPEDRERLAGALQPLLEEIADGHSVTPGDLNYLITKLCHAYVERKGLSYTHLNDVTGVLESAKLEFYRRKVTPYEDAKITENGDV